MKQAFAAAALLTCQAAEAADLICSYRVESVAGRPDGYVFVQLAGFGFPVALCHTSADLTVNVPGLSPSTVVTAETCKSYQALLLSALAASMHVTMIFDSTASSCTSVWPTSSAWGLAQPYPKFIYTSR